MDDKQVIERIKYLIDSLRYKQSDFAKKIGVDPSNLSKYLNGRIAVSDSLLNRITVNLGVSKKWLESGDDIPYAKQQPAVKTLHVGEGQLQQPTRKGVPVYDIDVTAGNMPRERMFASDQIIGSIDLPELSPDSRIVRVSGDSMQPVICNGDFIAVRELSNIQQIFWGQIYVVLLDDYRLVKYIRKHPNPSMLILRSENPNYDDMEVPRTDVRDLMFVQDIIHVDVRM